jgi:hypothetical protein
VRWNSRVEVGHPLTASQENNPMDNDTNYPAPTITKAIGDKLHYKDVNGGAYISSGPYPGIAIGQEVGFSTTFDNTNGAGWLVKVETARDVTHGVVGTFSREHLLGNTTITVQFRVGTKKSDPRTYDLVFE